MSQWIAELRAGDKSAAQRLWERYVEHLTRLARRKLGASSRRVSDEEDVVITAFENFCRGILDGRFPQMDDRNDLWQVLVMLTQRKAVDQVRRSSARRKVEVGESHLGAADTSQSQGAGPGQVAGTEPTPEFAAEVAEEFRRLLDALDDDTLRQVANWKMEGFTNDEIGRKLGCVTRTVERKLDMIRQRWETVGASPRTGG